MIKFIKYLDNKIKNKVLNDIHQKKNVVFMNSNLIFQYI